MRYAIAKINGYQYKFKEGDELVINKIPGKEGDILTFDEVLLFSDEDKVKIGKPTLENIKIEAKILKGFQGDKVEIFKFKAKTGYRRKTGFRAQKTLLKIEKIKKEEEK